MTRALRETAYAKINLALHVRRRRDDGYHELETLFAFVDAGDVLVALGLSAAMLMPAYGQAQESVELPTVKVEDTAIDPNPNAEVGSPYKARTSGDERHTRPLAETPQTITVIPEAVIARPPSAELRENQKDQDSLPPYDVLDAILLRPAPRTPVPHAWRWFLRANVRLQLGHVHVAIVGALSQPRHAEMPNRSRNSRSKSVSDSTACSVLVPSSLVSISLLPDSVMRPSSVASVAIGALRKCESGLW